jgi:plastocyanin
LKRIVSLFIAAVAVAATLVVPAQAKFTGLKGEVNDNFQIKVTRNGVRLRTIKAGTYRIKVEDKSSSHNFRLKGRGFNRATGVAFIGERTWTVTLKPGKYTFQCDPHATQGMRGTFRVTA